MRAKLRLGIVGLVLLLAAAIGPVQNALAETMPAPPPPNSFVQVQTQIVQLPGGTPRTPPYNWLVYVRQLIRGCWPAGLPWYVQGSGWFVRVAHFVRLPVVPMVPRSILCLPIAGVPIRGCYY